MFGLSSVFWPLVSVVILTSATNSSDYCTAKPQHRQCGVQVACLPGDITVGVLVNVHRQDEDNPCSMALQTDAVMALEAVRWIFDGLNQKGYIPGVTIGLRAYDTCGREDAAQAALLRLAPEVVQPRCDVTFPSAAGMLGLFASGQAMAVAAGLADTPLPLLSPSATATSLNDRTKYANFFRTVSTNADHVKVLQQVVIRLDWKYVAVIHTDDPYGIGGAEEFVILARQAHICVGFKQGISKATFINDVVVNLIQLLKNTAHNRLGVVFFGQKATANQLITRASYHLPSNEVRRLMWLMSDAVGTDDDLLKQYPDVAQNVISVSPSSLEVTDFKDHWGDVVHDALTNDNTTASNWIKTYANQAFGCAGKDCSQLTRDDVLTSYRQPLYLFQTITATYTYAKAIYDLHSLCTENNIKEDCKRMSYLLTTGKMVDVMKALDFQFWDNNNFDMFPFLPASLKSAAWRMRFDNQTGGKIPEVNKPSYFIHNLKCAAGKLNCGFRKVGEYFPQGERLVMNLNDVTLAPSDGEVVQADSLQPVVCLQNCQGCQTHSDSDSYVYVPGDFLLLGTFPIHHPSKTDPFRCSEEIRSVGSVQLMEAFLMAVDQLNVESPLPGGATWGGLVLDDCYNSLKANTIVSRFLSGETVIKHNDTTAVSPDKVVAVIGGLPSQVSKSVAGITRSLHLLQVSYGSTSTTLSSESNFLRTLPADDAQAKALVELVKEMGWNTFNIIYREGPYGTSGYEAMKGHAKNLKICISQAISIKRNPNDKTELSILLAGLPQSEAVVLFMSNEEVKEVLSVAKSRDMKFVWIGTESWADRMSVLENSTTEGLGSLTLKIKTGDNALFRDHFTQLDMGRAQPNPFFLKYWETKFQCKIPNSDFSSFTNECVQGEHSLATDYQQDTYVVHVLDAVLATGKGIAKVLPDMCPDINQCGPVELRTEKNIRKIVDAVKDVEWMVDGSRYRPFTARGDGSAPYIIYNVRPDATRTGYYEEIGIYDQLQGLKLNTSETALFYDLNGEEIKVESTCKTDCLQCAPEDTEAELWQKQVHVTGDVILAALLSMHQSPRGNSRDVGNVCPEGLLVEEAFAWAVQQVNNDSTLLPKTTLGYHVLDSFSDAETAAWQAVGMLGPGRYLHLRDTRIDPDLILGFVTGAENDVTLAIQEVTRRHHLLQIDYKATLALTESSDDDSDEDDDGAYFVRNSLSAVDELNMLARVLSKGGWRQVTVIYSVHIWGKDGQYVVETIIENQDMCVDTVFSVGEVVDSELLAIKDYMKQLLDEEKTVVLLLLKQYQIKEIIKEFDSALGFKKTTNIIFAGGANFIHGVEDWKGYGLQLVDNAIGLKPSSAELDESLSLHLHNLVNHEQLNPWWTSAKWVESLALLDSPSTRDVYVSYVRHVVSAVYSFAWGLTQHYRALCPDNPIDCDFSKTNTDYKVQLSRQVKNTPEQIAGTDYAKWFQLTPPSVTVYVTMVTGNKLQKQPVGTFIDGSFELMDGESLPSPDSTSTTCESNVWWSNNGYIAMVVILPLLLVIALVILIVCIVRRKRTKKPNDKSMDIYDIAGKGVYNPGLDYNSADERSRSGSQHSASSPVPPPVPSLGRRPSLADMLEMQRQTSTGVSTFRSPSASDRVASVKSGSSSGRSHVTASPTNNMPPPSYNQHVHRAATMPHGFSTGSGPHQTGSLPGHYDYYTDLSTNAPGGPPVVQQSGQNFQRGDFSPVHPHHTHIQQDSGEYLSMSRPSPGSGSGYYSPSSGSGSTDYAYQQRHLQHQDLPHAGFQEPEYANGPESVAGSNTNSDVYSPGGSINSTVVFANESITMC